VYPFPQLWTSAGAAKRHVIEQALLFSESVSLLKTKYIAPLVDVLDVAEDFLRDVEWRDAPENRMDYFIQFTDSQVLLKMKYITVSDTAQLAQDFIRDIEDRDVSRPVEEVTLLTDSQWLSRTKYITVSDLVELLGLPILTVQNRDTLHYTGSTTSFTDSHSVSKSRSLLPQVDRSSLTWPEDVSKSAWAFIELFSQTTESRDVTIPALAQTMDLSENHSTQKIEMRPSNFYGGVQESSCENPTVNVELYWDNNGFTGTLVLERKLSSSNTWEVVNNSITSGSTYVLDTGLTKNEMYNYRIRFNASAYYTNTSVFTDCWY
jgi:hypothetical protein